MRSSYLKRDTMSEYSLTASPPHDVATLGKTRL